MRYSKIIVAVCIGLAIVYAAATLVGYYLLGLEPPGELTKYLYTCIIGELVALAFKSVVGDTTEARKTKTNTIGDDGKGAAG